MMHSGFWLVIAATGAVFFVAFQDAGAIVPLSSRPNWRARVDAAMLMLPLAGVGAALLLR
jgi:hypothetical protein